MHPCLLLEISEHKKYEVNEQYKTLQNEKLRDLCRPPSDGEIMEAKRAQNVIRIGETRNSYKIWVGKITSKTSNWRTMKDTWGSEMAAHGSGLDQ